jgi:CheY-like chemotaxis protein
MSQQLSRLGCAKVHTANHGLEMPIMDGLTCARRIRELENAQEIIKHVPICGITANARTSQIDACIEAGMDEVVVSPLKVLLIIASADIL